MPVGYSFFVMHVTLNILQTENISRLQQLEQANSMDLAQLRQQVNSVCLFCTSYDVYVFVCVRVCDYYMDDFPTTGS